MKKLLTLFCFSLILVVKTVHVQAQAKSAIGLGPALNASKNGQGFGGVLMAEIKVAKAFSVEPSIGVEIPYTAYLGLAGKYYFADRIHANLGALLHIGGEDASDSGIGGTIGIGRELMVSRRHVLDLNLHGDVIKMDGNAAPVVGLRLTYQFCFGKGRAGKE